MTYTMNRYLEVLGGKTKKQMIVHKCAKAFPKLFKGMRHCCHDVHKMIWRLNSFKNLNSYLRNIPKQLRKTLSRTSILGVYCSCVFMIQGKIQLLTLKEPFHCAVSCFILHCLKGSCTKTKRIYADIVW